MALFLPMRSMRNAGQFVMMYRSLKDWEWYHDLPVRVLFLHLMLEVNWKPGRFEGVPILPGQVPTSADKLAASCGLSRQTVRTALTKLQSTNEITIKSTKRFSVVTIVNWAEYQFVPDVSTNKSTNLATTNQPQINHQLTTIEEGNTERSKEKSSALVSATRKPSSIEERKADFVAKCKAVVDVDPGKLPDEHRKPFFEYWTETTQDGSKMRFEGEKFFVHSRRMATWMTTANKITSNGGGFKTNSNGAKTYDGWTVEKVEAYLKQFKAENNGRYPNSGDVNIPKAYKLFKEWI